MDRFPIMALKYGEKLGYVPMAFMLRFERRAQRNHGQSISRLAERGGLCPQEAMAVVNDTSWHDRRWKSEQAAWANLQLIVSMEYPDWKF